MLSIDLIKCNYTGCFWNLSKLNFEDFTSVNPIGSFECNLKWYNVKRKIKLEKSKKQTNTIRGTVKNTLFPTNFIFFNLYKSDGIMYLKINLLKRKDKHDPENVRNMLDILDKLALAFGVHFIFLQDAATPENIEQKSKDDIDYTLLTVMRDNQTFYEKYGYYICDAERKEHYIEIKTIDLNIHKKLLKEFNFEIFYQLLDKDDKIFVDKYSFFKEKRLDLFYSRLYDNLDIQKTKYKIENDKKNRNRIKKDIIHLQRLLTNENYPWYAMVNIIQTSKFCMMKKI